MTTAATWVVNDRGDTGPLEVLTVQPAHATPTVPDPINPAARAAAQREQQAAESHLRATAYWDAARRSTTTTTVARAAPRPATTVVAAAPVVPSGPVPEGCMTGTRKTRAESDRCWTPLLAAYPWPLSTMQQIVWCESGGDESAVNSVGATGLLQLYSGTGNAWPGGQDPVENIADGYNVKYLSQGLSAWSASGGCW